MEPEPEPDPAMACGGGGIEDVAEVGMRPTGGVGAAEGFWSPRRIWVMRHHGGGAPDVVFEARRPATCGVAERLGSPDGGGWGPPAPNGGSGGSSQDGRRPAEGRFVAATVAPMLELRLGWVAAVGRTGAGRYCGGRWRRRRGRVRVWSGARDGIARRRGAGVGGSGSRTGGLGDWGSWGSESDRDRLKRAK
jgi:hypothetical protein